jgi:hypothetical protein
LVAQIGYCLEVFGLMLWELSAGFKRGKYSGKVTVRIVTKMLELLFEFYVDFIEGFDGLEPDCRWFKGRKES